MAPRHFRETPVLTGADHETRTEGPPGRYVRDDAFSLRVRDTCAVMNSCQFGIAQRIAHVDALPVQAFLRGIPVAVCVLLPHRDEEAWMRNVARRNEPLRDRVFSVPKMAATVCAG